MKKRKLLILPVLAVFIGITALAAMAHGNADPNKPAKMVKEKLGVSARVQEKSDSQRVIFSPKPGILKQASLWLKKCRKVQEPKGEAAYECPEETGLELADKGEARIDRVFYPLGLAEDYQINADKAWSAGLSGQGVKVAILDTGIDLNHIELSDSIVATRSFIRPARIYDYDGHGTHVAGIISGNGLLDFGGDIAKGASPNAQLIIGKVCGDYCYESDISAGIDWAIKQGAQVINLSLGSGNFSGHCDEDPLAQRINSAVGQGVVVVVASGNHKDGEAAGVSSPACASQAIAVGAVDHSDNIADFSNYGPALDISAPGVDVFSTYSCYAMGDCSYYWGAVMSGTSMAAPHVAGAAALVLEKYPEYTVDGVKDALYGHADDIDGNGWDEYYGYGRLDLSFLGEPETPVDSDNDGYLSDVDCDDGDPEVYPGALEICNNIDDNCDGTVDEGFDIDGDQYTACGGDCDDGDPAVNPGASDSDCDGVDDNCSGEADEGYIPLSCGLGICESFSVCSQGTETDCVPGIPEDSENCGDLLDNDCDGEINEGCTNLSYCGDGKCDRPEENRKNCFVDCGK